MRATDTELLERCSRFDLELDQAVATDVERFAWGTAILDRRLPLVWDANYVFIEWPGMSAREVATVADEVLGGAGLAHREVGVVDSLEGERLAPGMEQLGYEAVRDVYMVRRREPDRPAGVLASETRFAEQAELRRRLLLDVPQAESEETIEQLLEWDRLRGEAGGDRWFVASLEGNPASSCCLFQRGGVGQVESVNTLSTARQRGLARGVVLAATEASVGDADELTFIVAAARDWPQLLYHRLGFDPIGEIAGFRRPPP